MRFSLYSELQLHPGKTPRAALRGGARADRQRRPARVRRLRGDRAFLLSRSSRSRRTRPRSSQPRRSARRTSAFARCSTPAVPQPDRAGERHQHDPHPHRRPLRVGGRPRSRLDSRRRPESRSTSTHGPATRRRSTCCSPRSTTRSSRITASTSTSTTRTSSRSCTTPYRVYLGGTSDRTYTLAAERGWGVAVPPLLPYKVLETQLDLYRESCAAHGTTPDIVWIHACHLDEDRDTALREGRDWVTGFIQGNCSPLTEHEKPPTRRAASPPATASTRPGSWNSSPRSRTSS